MTSQQRQPAGTPSGGQFASGSRAESCATLSAAPAASTEPPLRTWPGLAREQDINGTRVLTTAGSEHFAPMTVRVLLHGDRYGRDESLRHEGDEPLIEFYDARYRHTPYGQFVSRYYASSIAEGSRNGWEHSGLDLQGDVPSWKLTAEHKVFAAQWAQEEIVRRRAGEEQ